MDNLWGVITSNYIINVGVTSWFSAQLIKTILTFFRFREVRLERMFGAGGMPSSHSALAPRRRGAGQGAQQDHLQQGF